MHVPILTEIAGPCATVHPEVRNHQANEQVADSQLWRGWWARQDSNLRPPACEAEIPSPIIPYVPFSFLYLSIIWGICFRSIDNPNNLKSIGFRDGFDTGKPHVYLTDVLELLPPQVYVRRGELVIISRTPRGAAAVAGRYSDRRAKTIFVRQCSCSLLASTVAGVGLLPHGHREVVAHVYLEFRTESK